MSDPTPEPTEERPTWRALAIDAIQVGPRDADDALAHLMELHRRRDALLAAEPEHLPVLHVVEGESMARPFQHWHVRVVARNGETLLSSETYTERRGATEAAHLVADLCGASVVDDATGEAC